MDMHTDHTMIRFHTPVPDPEEDEEQPDVRHPPVPPDQEDEVVPQRDPPDNTPPMVARA